MTEWERYEKAEEALELAASILSRAEAEYTSSKGGTAGSLAEAEGLADVNCIMRIMSDTCGSFAGVCSAKAVAARARSLEAKNENCVQG